MKAHKPDEAKMDNTVKDEPKKPYRPPQLKKHGRIEKTTGQQPSPGIIILSGGSGL